MKMLRLTQFVAAPMLMLLVSVPAWGAPLDASRLPQNAKWVVHVDLDAVTDTELAKQARQNRPAIVNQVRQWVQNQYGIDPREDLHSLTAFSDSYESHTGAMILHAEYDQNKVREELKNKENVKTASWGDHTLYTVHRKGLLQDANTSRPASNKPREETFTIILVDGETAVFASTPDRAKAVVKLLKGESPSLKEDSKLLADRPEQVIAYGAAVDLNTIQQREGIYPVLRQMERIVWVLGEENGKVVDKLTVTAQSEEVAKQVKTALEGMIAFGKISAADSESLTKLAEGTDVKVDGKTVQRKWSGDNQVVLNALGDLSGRLQQRIEALIP